MARQGSFIPPSLSSFSWPSEVYDVVVRGPLLHPANISMVQFKRTYGTSTAQVSQIHLSSTPLSATLSAPNYVTIMDFVHGNLNDFLHPKNAPPPKPSHPKEVNFNPAMKFGPAPGATATFRLTLAIPKVAVVLEAHPREWTDPQPVFTFASAAESHILRPFFHASASNLLMDLGNLPPGDTFINFCATSLDLQDLRLGYRLSEVSASAPAGGLHVQGDMPLSPLRRMGHLPGITIPGVSSEEGTPPGAVLLPPRQPSEDSVYGSPGGSTGSPVSWQSDAETPRTPQFSFLRPRPEDSDRPTPGMGSGQSSTNAQGRREVLTQGPHTGIRLSVARRLSEHSHRHRAASDGDSATPGTHGAPTPGRTASGGVPRYYLPVLDFVELPEVESTLGAEAAALRVLTAPHHAPPEERLPGNTSTRLPGSNPNVRLEVSVALLADSTTAVEVALSSALLQWPYFQDISLVSHDLNQPSNKNNPQCLPPPQGALLSLLFSCLFLHCRSIASPTCSRRLPPRTAPLAMTTPQKSQRPPNTWAPPAGYTSTPCSQKPSSSFL